MVDLGIQANWAYSPAGVFRVRIWAGMPEHPSTGQPYPPGETDRWPTDYPILDTGSTPATATYNRTAAEAEALSKFLRGDYGLLLLSLPAGSRGEPPWMLVMLRAGPHGAVAVPTPPAPPSTSPEATVGVLPFVHHGEGRGGYRG